VRGGSGGLAARSILYGGIKEGIRRTPQPFEESLFLEIKNNNTISFYNLRFIVLVFFFCGRKTGICYYISSKVE